MRTKQPKKRQTRTQKKGPGSPALARKRSARIAAKKRRSKAPSRTSRSVGEAAARVAKSAARLVGHAGMQMVETATDTARAALGGALESAAELVKGPDAIEPHKTA